MDQENTPTIKNHLVRMIEKYCENPMLFLAEGKPDRRDLEKLVSESISIDPVRRGGYACIKGTRIAVCDIITETVSLHPRKGFERKSYGGAIAQKSIDVAYAFLLLERGKVAQDFYECYGHTLPKNI